MKLTRDSLIDWFIKEHSFLYKRMTETNHCVDIHQPNPFHAEGTVWTHTMMVMTYIMCQYSVNDDTETEKMSPEYTVLLTTGLLHDIGKPLCKEYSPANDKKPERNSFKGHEGASTIKAVGVLKKLQKSFPDYYTDSVVEMTIKLISTHGVYIDESETYEDQLFHSLRERFRYADKRGAVRLVDEAIFGQYQPRKYAPVKNTQFGKNIIFMIGLPCSGKSTYVEENFKDYHVISRDSMLMEFDPENTAIMSYNETYSFIHSDEKKLQAFNQYFEKQLVLAAKEHDNVVIDMTMLSLKSRRTMMNKFPKHERNAVVVMTDVHTINARNNARQGKFISDTVLKGMMRSFVFPVKEEGFETIELIIN